MSLQTWLANKWLFLHQTSREEVARLLDVADRDLRQSQMPGLSPDWRLNIAYNAALQSAAAALAAAGYRAMRESHHVRVIASLEFTVGFSAAKLKRLDRFRLKRNTGIYEQAGMVTEKEAREMISLAEELRLLVEDWMRRQHPSLAPA